jgi:hypothetical protein
MFLNFESVPVQPEAPLIHARAHLLVNRDSASASASASFGGPPLFFDSFLNSFHGHDYCRRF